REYDLADISLQGELARRWPEAHVNPGYSWGHDGIRQDPLNDVRHENALGVGFELPVFNQHQGAIGEAIARRDTAREHLVAIQAEVLVLQAAYEAELAFGALEDAYRRPLQGPDGAPRNPMSPAS